MEQSYIKEALKAAGVKELNQDDVPWIQYMVNNLEPIMDTMTPSYYKGSKIDQPWIFELLTFNWR